MTTNMTRIDGLEKYRKQVLAGERVLTKKRDPIQLAIDKPTSLRAAINAKCFDCTGFNKHEVAVCTAKDCPLWRLRPWQKKV